MGSAPKMTYELVVATKDIAEVRTLSPALTPFAWSESVSAAVPELTAMAWSTPHIFANISSNLNTLSPSVSLSVL